MGGGGIFPYITLGCELDTGGSKTGLCQVRGVLITVIVVGVLGETMVAFGWVFGITPSRAFPGWSSVRIGHEGILFRK